MPRRVNTMMDDVPVEAGCLRIELVRVDAGVADLAPEEWTPARLAERRRRLAARAVRLWRSDFA